MRGGYTEGLLELGDVVLLCHVSLSVCVELVVRAGH